MSLRFREDRLGCQDSNLGMVDPKTTALPLGHTRIFFRDECYDESILPDIGYFVNIKICTFVSFLT